MFAKAITLIAALASVASAAPTLQRRSSGTMTFYNPAGGTVSFLFRELCKGLSLMYIFFSGLVWLHPQRR